MEMLELRSYDIASDAFLVRHDVIADGPDGKPVVLTVFDVDNRIATDAPDEAYHPVRTYASQEFAKTCAKKSYSNPRARALRIDGAQDYMLRVVTA